MKILYRQPENSAKAGALDRFGVANCYLKYLQSSTDGASVIKNEHHHTGFEIHIIREGVQKYRIAGQEYILRDGNFLFIPPRVPHQMSGLDENTKKFSVTFQLTREELRKCCVGTLDGRQIENLRFLEKESESQREMSPVLVENCLMETIVTILRLAGMEEERCPSSREENAVLGLAKQYIADNIDRAPEVQTVAQYCGLSTKQLSRFFRNSEGMSPGAYILYVRVGRIEELLQNTELSLSQISEKLHFSSEYYFNTFFKKYAGMPPGAYRNMHAK